ncbi:hypothetical protein [Paenibacillus albidus]|uniref:hypothetical protein n=1 Tax=Paenibacillus albidus TaxID=2041023 RepID=UPI00166C46E9|nr:hypothetical protein [Paenibacillus albidus]
MINGKVIQSEQSAIYTEGSVMVPLREVAKPLATRCLGWREYDPGQAGEVGHA